MPRRNRPELERRASRSRSVVSAKAKSQNRIGYALIAFFSIVIIGGAYFYIDTVMNKPVFDKITMCPVNKPPAEIISILIDASDKMSPVQVASIRNEIDGYRNSLPRTGAMEVYTVGRTEKASLQPLFKACNPGSPEEFSALTESIPRATRRWRDDFISPVDSALTKALPSSEQATSPIMESLQSVAVTAFGPADRKDITKRLIIVSDMMQNSSKFSNYKSMDYESFRSAAGENLMTDLRGVEVQILYIRRHSKQGAKHIEFWQSYLAEQGARLTRVFSVSG